VLKYPAFTRRLPASGIAPETVKAIGFPLSPSLRGRPENIPKHRPLTAGGPEMTHDATVIKFPETPSMNLYYYSLLFFMS
jgi:hypothetical protein